MPPYEEYIEAIRPLWDSHWLTNMGIFHQELEKKLKEYLKVAELSLFVNGHMALEMAIQAFGFPEGSEVITTPFTFISTTHAIVRNHFKPIFCDVKLADGTIDETKIEDLITEKTAAIIPVHVYGHVCNVEEIEKIAYKYNLKVIYDAAHAFGVEYKGKGIGCYGDASIFSFHATKVFNTIEGGAVTFTNPGLYEKLYNLKNFGIRGEELVCEVGANAKMNEFSAIMGLCNLQYISAAMEKRAGRYSRYREGLKKIKGIRMLGGNESANNNYAYCPIVIGDEYKMTRDELHVELQKNHIFTRKYFYPLASDEACFKNKYRHVALDHARDLSKRILVLPMYEELAYEMIDKILEIMGN